MSFSLRGLIEWIRKRRVREPGTIFQMEYDVDEKGVVEIRKIVAEVHPDQSLKVSTGRIRNKPVVKIEYIDRPKT